MRTVAAVVTGAFAGMLLGVLSGDVAAGVLGTGGASSPRPLLIGSAPEVLAVVGGALAWLVSVRRPPDHRNGRRR